MSLESLLSPLSSASLMEDLPGTKIKQPVIRGLLVLHPYQAAAAGFQSITTDIKADTEPRILAGVAQHRDPKRAVWIITAPGTYQLAIIRADISDLKDRTHFGF